MVLFYLHNLFYCDWTRIIYKQCVDPNYPSPGSGSGCIVVSQSENFSSTATTASTTAYNIVDYAGNTKTCPSVTVNVYVDNTAPTCTVAKTNTGTIDGVTITITRTDSGGSAVTVPGPYTNVKATATYSLSDAVGNTGNCTGDATVTKVTEYQRNTCTLYCASSACTCASYGGYSCSTTTGSTCTPTGSAGTTAMYRTCADGYQYSYTLSYRCIGSTETEYIYSSYVYADSSNAFQACDNRNPPCSSNTVICSTSSAVTHQRITTCNGSCATYNRCLACGCEKWGGWTGWSTTVCTAAANQVQCKTRYIYN